MQPADTVPADAEVAEEGEDYGDDHPSDAAVRRMSKPDLLAYGEELGLEFDAADTREDMIEAILKHREEPEPDDDAAEKRGQRV